MSTRREVYTCVTERNLPALRAAIAAGHSVEERAVFGHSPLMAAAAKNLVDIARVLLDSGAELEATNKFGDTALYEACDNRATETALLLLSRGARGDAQGASGRTPLQLAVKRGAVEIVRALLASGQADPNTLSSYGKDALYYVQKRDPNAAELRQLLSEYMSLETAIERKNATAIQVLLRREMDKDDNLARSVDAYLKASKITPLEPFRVQLLLATIAANNTTLFERVLVPGEPQPSTVARLDALNTLRFASHSATSALHIAAFYGHGGFVEYLLLDCGMDPCVEDALRRRAVQLVDDRKDPSGTVRALLVQTTRRRHTQVFSNRLLTCTGQLSDLEGLAQSLATVYDLRVVFSLSAATLATRPDDMKCVLTHALTRLVNENLVLDDREALFSKMALRECLRRGYLTATEFEYWNMQIVKVNMESAPWVAALQQSVRRLDTRVADVELQTQVLQRQYKQLRETVQNGPDGGNNGSLGQSLSMVTSLLGVLDDSGDASSDSGALFDGVFDLSSPQDVLAALLNASGGGDVSAFLNDAASSLSELVVPAQLQEMFESAGVDPVEFAGLLKDAILGDQGDNGQEEVGDPEVIDASDALGELAIEEKDSDPLALGENETDDQDVGDDTLVAFPYHFAVKHSGGELAVFQDVIAYIDPNDGDVNAVASVTIPAGKSESGGAEQLEDVSPAVYASQLGFVEIVKYLLLRQDVRATEKRFVTMQRAQQRAAKRF